ncbi:MAG: hypothetical protein FWG88_10420 [Oscillospiraceae bacterium]|nr:hypothetical protein [Oscillospiraceae bacterium]
MNILKKIKNRLIDNQRFTILEKDRSELFNRIDEIWTRLEDIDKKTINNSSSFNIGNSSATNEPNNPLNQNKLNIAFLIRGGLGDIVMLANYIYMFRKKFSDDIINIDIFSDDHRFESTRTVFNGVQSSFINNLYARNKDAAKLNYYDLFIDIARYPDIKKRDLSRISEMVPELIEYIFLCERFRAEYSRFFTHQGPTDGQSAMVSIIKGAKRYQQADIYGFLGMSEKYEHSIHIAENENAYLQQLGLYNRNFITINRGNDSAYAKNSTKIWPLSYYGILIRLLKKRFPNIILVQIGADSTVFPILPGADMHLVSQTSLEQVKVLLKHATLHIDGEGGLVHMRHALNGGKSIVLFGPTSAEFFGYSENENIVGKGCDVWCEWAFSNWQDRCLRGKSSAFSHCMASIIPEKVLMHIENVLTNNQEEQ